MAIGPMETGHPTVSHAEARLSVDRGYLILMGNLIFLRSAEWLLLIQEWMHRRQPDFSLPRENLGT